MSQTQVHLHNKEINSLSGQTLVVFAKASPDKAKAAKITHVDTAKALQVSLDEKLITGAANEVISFREARFLGYRNVVTADVDALLVPPDRPTALAGALSRVLGDRGLAVSLAEAGTKRAEAFSMDALAEEYEALYQTIVR